MHAGYPSDFGKSLDPLISLKTDTAATMERQDTTLESPTKEENRGRRRNREDGTGPDGDGENGAEGDDTGAGGSSRKRRRSRKGLDKKFECPHEGCGKSYSRAEHLYRHQLNHNPKQIYHCDFPECHRSFVRQDLCARHKERHTARGSQLLRKDTFMHNINPIVQGALAGKNLNNAKFAKPQNSPTIQQPPNEKGYMMQAQGSAMSNSGPVRSDSSPSMDPTMQSPTTDSGMMRSTNPLARTKSDESYRGSDGFTSTSNPRTIGSMDGTRQGSFGAMNNGRPQMSPPGAEYARPGMQSQGSVGASNMQQLSMNSPYEGPSQQAYNTPTQRTNSYPPQSPANYQSQQQNFNQLSSLPPPVHSPMTQASQGDQKQEYPTTSAQMEGNIGAGSNSVSEASLLDQMTPSYSMPVFGGEGYSRSPFAMADDFTAWLFNDSNFGAGASPMGYPNNGNMPNMMGSATLGLQAPYFGYDPMASGYFSQQAPPQHPMAVNSILDTSLPESALSEDKRQQVLDLIIVRFNETDHAPVRRQKEGLLEGDMSDSSHLLSLHMMQTYISSYWIHVHPQIPILHRPTFNAASCPELLLIAMMALGSASLDKSFGLELTSNSSDLSNFLAWHLRWEIFMDADFRPPAKLWVFQALLLLEIFEKMYSTRPLHERAHIHHATTLTLMRRGSSLIGRSAVESPPSLKDGKLAIGTNGSGSGVNTPNDWWNHWVINEATRRAAFAAFVMDSTHATMFGHSAVMVAHEMRLPLPCDEALWSATSGSEVVRLEQCLQSNGIKPTTFLDGLKKTLNGQSVRTNSFGRTILMAGLLSVSWHMNQRDLQVSTLGVSQALGGRDKWRGSLTRAFDFWKQDFDSSLSKTGDGYASQQYGPGGGQGSLDDENVFESRTVLHHLAHMAMHVDIVDCQIYAGATRLLGRAITPQDYSGAQRRMKESWAPTARARDATFYALRFLSQVLVPEDHGFPPLVANPTGFDYSARDDFLLNRPWVLYFALLIVWSYGYALDGPIRPVYTLPTHEDKIKDMQGFLRRVGGVRAPDDLAKVPNNNACLGLLVLMRDMFRRTRWELLHEGSTLLTKCIEMLTGQKEV